MDPSQWVLVSAHTSLFRFTSCLSLRVADSDSHADVSYFSFSANLSRLTGWSICHCPHFEGTSVARGLEVSVATHVHVSSLWDSGPPFARRRPPEYTNIWMVPYFGADPITLCIFLSTLFLKLIYCFVCSGYAVSCILSKLGGEQTVSPSSWISSLARS